MKKIKISLAVISVICICATICISMYFLKDKNRNNNGMIEITGGELKDTIEKTESYNSTGENTPTEIHVISNSYEYVPMQTVREKADIICIAQYTGNKTKVIVDDEMASRVSSPVYTDYSLEVKSVYKGEQSKTVNIRLTRGVIGDTEYIMSGEPNFEVGKNYLICLVKGNAINKNDGEHYYISYISQEFSQIGETIEFNSGKPDDDKIISEIYQAATNNALN